MLCVNVSLLWVIVVCVCLGNCVRHFHSRACVCVCVRLRVCCITLYYMRACRYVMPVVCVCLSRQPGLLDQCSNH